MRVDFGEWYTRPGLVARGYTFSQMEGARNFGMEIHFDIQAGLSIFTFLSIRIEDIDLPQETVLRVSFQHMDNRQPLLIMKMVGTPDGRSGAVLGMATREDVSKCIRLFSEGKHMHFEIATERGETLMKLPLPNDSKFRDVFDKAYRDVRDADDAEFKGDDGVLGRLNRFFRDLSGR